MAVIKNEKTGCWEVRTYCRYIFVKKNNMK